MTNLNFANHLQAALGLEISAAQFLACEGASCLAFQAAASVAMDEGTGDSADLANLANLAAEKARGQHAARTTAAADLERLTRDFLRAIWVNDADPDEWLAATARAAINPEIIRMVGKAADAIEGRCQCRWGRDTTDAPGFAALVDAIDSGEAAVLAGHTIPGWQLISVCRHADGHRVCGDGSEPSAHKCRECLQWAPRATWVSGPDFKAGGFSCPRDDSRD